ncbi:MAG TPA: phosphatase PAP2 family protein [Gallionellaceae bacterium]|jgi:membrane-associated phospholipid phosphatase
MKRLLDLPLRYFSAYLAIIAIAEVLNLTLWALLFCIMLITMLWLGKRHTSQPSWRRLAAVCAFLAVGMNVSYQAMAGAVPALRETRFDDQLLAIDRTLLGETPSVMLQHIATPWLTEVLSLCYIFFMPLLFFSLLRYFFRQRELLGEFYSGLFTVYGLGFLGYLLVPAAGPWLAHADLFQLQLTGGPITALNSTMVVQGSNRVDVWPSLHCAVSTFILGFAWRHHRREFAYLLLPVAGLWFSTLYLRYHYLIDVLCGFALATFALYESRRYAISTSLKDADNVSAA